MRHVNENQTTDQRTMKLMVSERN